MGLRASADALDRLAMDTLRTCSPGIDIHGTITPPSDRTISLARVIREAPLPDHVSSDTRATLEAARRELADRFEIWDNRKVWDATPTPGAFHDHAEELARAVVSHLSGLRDKMSVQDLNTYASEVVTAVAALGADLRSFTDRATPLVRAVWNLEARAGDARSADVASVPSSITDTFKWLREPLGTSASKPLLSAIAALEKAAGKLEPRATDARRTSQITSVANEIAEVRAVLSSEATLDQNVRRSVDARLSAFAVSFARMIRSAVLS